MSLFCTPEWLTAIGTIGAVVAALFIAIFQDRLKMIGWHPSLVIYVDNGPPDCHVTTLSPPAQPNSSPCYFLRLRVINEGNLTATNTEIHLDRIEIQIVDGKFIPYDEYLPLNLSWSHIGGPFYPRIMPGTYRFCDLGHVLPPEKRIEFIGIIEDHKKLEDVKGRTVFSIDQIVKPYTGSHLLKPGRYRLHLSVAADNFRPRTVIIELSLSGKWYDDPGKMAQDGVRIRIVK